MRAGFSPVRVLGRDADIDGSRIKLRLNQLTALNERYLVVELDAASSKPTDDVAVAQIETRYLDLQAGKRRKSTAYVNASISDDKARQEASRNKQVLSEITTQIATERSEKAVDLRDKGDLAGARKLLQENAAYLKSSRQLFAVGAAPASPKALKELKQLEQQSATAADNLDAKKWSKTRKSMRYQQHKAKVRQSY